MIRKSIVCAAAFAFVFSFTIAGGVSNAVDMGAEDMVLQTGNAKKPANFPHKAHQDKMECTACHHVMDADGKKITWTDDKKVQQCVTCHNAEKFPKGADGKANKLGSFKGAAHANCKDCHKKEVKAGNADAKISKCTGCHPKKKK